MIRTEHLVRRFHDLVAVDDVSLTVREGEVYGFLGPNGAGKSTTIRILTGFLPATSGSASVAGHDVSTDSLAVRRSIGYLPENVPLPQDARVDEYLDFRGRLKGLSTKDRAKRCDVVLDQCGLVPMRRRILSQLSRGYRQRVGLADALLADPPVLILDEPTGGLDPAQRQEVLELVADFAGRRTVLLSSHVLNEVENVCTRVAIIKNGRIVAEGARDELERTVGQAGSVLIAAAGAGEALRDRLIERGLAPVREGEDDVRVALADSADPAELLADLVAAGIPVHRFEPLARSLQQIFLDVTRS